MITNCDNCRVTECTTREPEGFCPRWEFLADAPPASTVSIPTGGYVVLRPDGTPVLGTLAHFAEVSIDYAQSGNGRGMRDWNNLHADGYRCVRATGIMLEAQP